MAKKRSDLSKGEMKVASAIWRLKSSSLGEIHVEVNTTESMEYTTVQSYVRRLIDKGYVKSKREGRANRYSSKIKPEKVIGRTIEQVLAKLFAGDAMPVMRHLIQERGISSEQIAELRQMIDEAEKESTDD